MPLSIQSTEPMEQPFLETPYTFADSRSRSSAMGEKTATIVDRLAQLEPQKTAQTVDFHRWMETQAELFRYTWKNSLLAYLQHPDARWLREPDEWNTDNYSIQQGASAIWVWEPIIAKACPVCQNSLEYHNKSHLDCTNHRSGKPEYWPRDVVGTKPAPHFDIYQVTNLTGDKQTNPNRLLPSASVSAINTFVRNLIEEDDYSVITTLPHEAEFEGYGRIRRNVMTFKPEIEILDHGIERQTQYLIEFHLLASTHEDSGQPTDRERECDSWVTAGVASYLGLQETPVTLYPGRLGESIEEVEEALDNISSKIETYRNRLRREALHKRNQFD